MNLPERMPRPSELATSPDVPAAQGDPVTDQLVQYSTQGGDLMSALKVQSFMMDYCGKLTERIANTSTVPKAYRGKPDEIFSTMMFGLEVGLMPLQSLNFLADINGNKSLYGDGPLALCKRSPVFEDIKEVLPDMSDQNPMAACYVKRRNSEWVCRTFSKTDAQQAGLWGKQGPWTQYTSRMLMFRARSWALRDAFPDVLSGIGIKEEMAEVWDAESRPRREVHRALGTAAAKEALSQPGAAGASKGGAEAGSAENAPSAGAEADQGPTPEQAAAYEKAIKAIDDARNVRELDAAAADGTPHPSYKQDLRSRYSARRKALRETTQAFVMELVQNADSEDVLQEALAWADNLKAEHSGEVVKAVVAKRESLGLSE